MADGGCRVATDTSSSSACGNKKFGRDAVQDSRDRTKSRVGDRRRGHLPKLWVQQFERDATGIANPGQVLHDRPKLKIAVSRQNSVRVSGELARYAGDIAKLDPTQVLI